jgi:ribonucleoside-diphosphate reductase alpha subunit
MDNNEMYVTKRSGKSEIVSFDKILKRIKKIGLEVGIKINYTSLVMKVIDQLYNNISTTNIDELSAEQCASMTSIHSDYNVLAGRIIISNHQKNTSSSFSETMTMLYNFKNKKNEPSSLVSKKLYDIVQSNPSLYDEICDYGRDYLIDYFGFKTLDKSYLIKINKKTIERPQHMWLRVSIGIHGNDIEKVKETYYYMSNKFFTHATPTLFNAGTNTPQLSSCYLIAMESDSIDGIYNTLKDCALISKMAGGIGLHIHNVRASGSHIKGTNGTSNGIVPMLRVFNNTAKYVDQCVHPDTIIYTKNGSMPISQCISGFTKVIGKTGEFEVIQKVLEHSYNGEMYRISFDNHLLSCLMITPEHPIYCVVNSECGNDVDFEYKLYAKRAEFSWVEAKCLNPGDYVVYSVPTYVRDVPDLTEELCYVYGLILSSIASMSININDNHFFILNRENNKNSEILNYFEKNNILYSMDEKNIYWEKSPNMPFCNSDFYDPLFPDDISIGLRWRFLPISKTMEIIRGFGYNHSRRLNKDVFYMKLRAQHPDIGIPYNNYMLVKVSSIQTMNYNGCVYDLQMKTEHNYLLQGGLVHNGGGKRNGSFAIYLEPWHADIEHFLQMRKNHGDEELKARDLFYAMWIPDLFMERVKTNKDWTLLCPNECPGLADVYGDEFVQLYEKYEAEDRGRKKINARALWFQILDAQMETGTPYLLYKDAVNRKSNQKNLGTIKSSNLCTEITEYSDENETAVCNLASIALPAFCEKDTSGNLFYNYEKLHEIAKIVTKNLNKIIDINLYPTEKTRVSNLKHRPIGIGVQGLADVFMIHGIPFNDDRAKQMNKDIFETIYHGALESSLEIAKVDGAYSTFQGSPASQGLLQFDLWDSAVSNEKYNWTQLKEDIMKYGLRNSLLLAPMPTASTSQILGYNECIEPITSNIYSRRTLAGEFVIVNKYLMNDLIELGLWNENIKNNIIANQGSIQHIDVIPPEIKNKYKTVWELPMKDLIDMSRDRGVFICQSQSLNLWIEDPNYNNLTSMHFYSWSVGLKTGIYYLRRRSRHKAQQFTIEPTSKKNGESEEICEMCSA